MSLTFPTVHLNGTAAVTLRESYEEAAATLTDAIRSVELSAPNARDYYVRGDGAFAQARAEHDSRLIRVKAVLEEVILIIDNLDVQESERLKAKASR